MQLDYAAPPQPGQRRSVKRWLVVTCSIVVVALGVRNAPAVLDRAELLYWQRACMNHVDSPDTIVYEEGPGAAKLLADPAYFPVRVPGTTIPAAARRPPTCWTKLRPSVSMLLAPKGCLVFLHRCEKPDGAERLVPVFYDPNSDGFNRVTIVGMPIRPATLMGSNPCSEFFGVGICGNEVLPMQHPRSVRIYAGQPSPQNPQFIRIRAVRDGSEERIMLLVRDYGVQ